jgi:hypothetical protein
MQEDIKNNLRVTIPKVTISKLSQRKKYPIPVQGL